MIYTVIFDSRKRENSIRIKKDCRALRQSILPLSAEISEYIDKAKNQSVNEERRAAYTSLLCSLKLFFDIDDARIVRDDSGKPRLLDDEVYFNISHSDGVTAVTLSDECEVGVDIQCQIEKNREKALEKRFIGDLKIKNERLDLKFYLCDENNGYFDFYEVDIDISECDSFSDKWVVLESLLKLSSGGFGDLHRTKNLAENTLTDIRKIKIDNKYFSLANSIKNG